jgi:hypothetical protein
MTQGATAWTAVVAGLPEFSCQKFLQERINNVSVKALLPARGDFLRLTRVGSSLVACGFVTVVG